MYNCTSPEVSKKLNKLEDETIFYTGIKNISGGYARADIRDFDKQYFYVELRWGIKSDCENTEHLERYKMSRSTLKLEDE